MKLPEKIKGRNRIRDGAIVLYFKRDHLHYSELAAMFKLSERRILEILAKNHAFIRRDKEWEKEKRIARLHQWLKNKPNSLKDPVDIQAELRKEIDGDGESNKSTGINKVVVIYPPSLSSVDEKKEKLNRFEISLPNTA